jgi:hypothetical protein
MQLVQFYIFSFFMSFLMSSYHPFFGLPNVLINIGLRLCTFLTIGMNLHLEIRNGEDAMTILE